MGFDFRNSKAKERHHFKFWVSKGDFPKNIFKISADKFFQYIIYASFILAFITIRHSYRMEVKSPSRHGRFFNV